MKQQQPPTLTVISSDDVPQDFETFVALGNRLAWYLEQLQRALDNQDCAAAKSILARIGRERLANIVTQFNKLDAIHNSEQLYEPYGDGFWRIKKQTILQIVGPFIDSFPVPPKNPKAYLSALVDDLYRWGEVLAPSLRSICESFRVTRPSSFHPMSGELIKAMQEQSVWANRYEAAECVLGAYDNAVAMVKDGDKA
jgi:hypothetical protein